MDIDKEEEEVLRVITEMDLRFTSGNSVSVEQATIKATQYEVLKAFVMQEIRNRHTA